jgi:hypothetical protein
MVLMALLEFEVAVVCAALCGAVELPRHCHVLCSETAVLGAGKAAIGWSELLLGVHVTCEMPQGGTFLLLSN